MQIDGILDRLRGGQIAAPIALSQVLVACADVDSARNALLAAGAEDLLDLLRRSGHGAEAIAALVREERQMTAETDARARLARWRALFDASVERNPEASVAFYSLGDPQLLAEATQEIVSWLDLAGVLTPQRRALDLGCGLGRVALAVAPRLAEIVGVDLSPGMIEEARRRAGAAAGVRFETTDGESLGHFRDGDFDLVLAVDAFPIVYDASAELLERHFAECRRVLAPGGDLIVFNLTYRADLGADRGDARRLADAHGLELAIAGERPFELWDGAAYGFRKPAGTSK